MPANTTPDEKLPDEYPNAVMVLINESGPSIVPFSGVTYYKKPQTPELPIAEDGLTALEWVEKLGSIAGFERHIGTLRARLGAPSIVYESSRATKAVGGDSRQSGAEVGEALAAVDSLLEDLNNAIVIEPVGLTLNMGQCIDLYDKMKIIKSALTRRGGGDELHEDGFTEEDMASVGHALMAVIARLPEDRKDWHPADCPTEIVFDLINEIDELKAAPTPLAADLVALRAKIEGMMKDYPDTEYNKHEIQYVNKHNLALSAVIAEIDKLAPQPPAVGDE